MITSFAPTKVVRIGNCRRCGMCCLLCEHVVLEFRRERGKYKHLFATCKIYETKERKDKGCDDYPIYPDRLMGKFCGFRFIDKKGQDVTTFRENPTLIEFDIPKIKLVRRD